MFTYIDRIEMWKHPTAEYALKELNRRKKDSEIFLAFDISLKENVDISEGVGAEKRNLEILNNDIKDLESTPNEVDSIMEKYRNYFKGKEVGLTGAQLLGYNPTDFQSFPNYTAPFYNSDL